MYAQLENSYPPDSGARPSSRARDEAVKWNLIVPGGRKHVMIEINGMAHIILTVSQYEEAKRFYWRLMPALGLENVFDGSNMCYFVGARTALGLQPCLPQHAGQRFEQGRVGLHHLCFRARSREDVDKVQVLLKRMNDEK